MNTIPSSPATADVAATQPFRKRLILIVDDHAENLQVLAGHLKEQGHEVLAANNGPRAIALFRNKKPDLILLDIMMPEMDGFEVCRLIKEDNDSADIPIIFLTARTETEDIVKGFHAGAVDYITKPFKPTELLARVKTHLELKSSRDLISAYNRQLERITSRLRKLNEDKNRFLGIVSHDIRGAFGNVISVARLLTDDVEAPSEAEAAEFLREIGVEAEHMIALAENLLNIDAIERKTVRLRVEDVEVEPLISFAVNTHRMAAKIKEIDFQIDCSQPLIVGDLTGCRQLLSNLISNAVKFSHAGDQVRICAEADGDNVKLSVSDDGPGISEFDQTQLFQPYTRLGNRGSGSSHSIGLGLSIVKLMVDAMGGSASCQSVLGEGTTFTVRLPRPRE